MPVPSNIAHTHGSRRDASMDEQKYATTLKLGNTTVHIVAPPTPPKEKIEQILSEYHAAGWAIWNSLSDEQKRKINKESNTGS